MASGPNTSWKIDGGKVEAVTDFIFLGSKITVGFVVLEKTFKSPLDSKKIKPVNPKGNQPWTFIGRTNTEAEAPIPWPSDAKS